MGDLACIFIRIKCTYMFSMRIWNLGPTDITIGDLSPKPNVFKSVYIDDDPKLWW